MIIVGVRYWLLRWIWFFLAWRIHLLSTVTWISFLSPKGRATWVLCFVGTDYKELADYLFLSFSLPAYYLFVYLLLIVRISLVCVVYFLTGWHVITTFKTSSTMFVIVFVIMYMADKFLVKQWAGFELITRKRNCLGTPNHWITVREKKNGNDNKSQ